MNNLVKISSICPSLTNIEAEFVIASNQKKIRDISKKDVTIFLNDLISKIHFECGQKPPDKDDLIRTVELIYPNILNYFSSLSLKDIEMAFTNGVRKQYGEYFGLNIISYEKWVSGYMMSQSRQESLKKNNKWLLGEKEEVVFSEEQKKEILKNGVIDKFEKFKNCGYVDDIGNVSYKYLDSIGIISFTVCKKMDFIAQAKIKLKQQKDIAQAKGSYERDRIREYLKSIENGINEEIKIEAMKIALNHLFKDMIDMNIEIKDLI